MYIKINFFLPIANFLKGERIFEAVVEPSDLPESVIQRDPNIKPSETNLYEIMLKNTGNSAICFKIIVEVQY